MTNQPGNVVGFHHPGVVVRDLEKATRFYCELLEYSVVSENAWDEDNAVFNQIVGLEGSAARLRMLKGGNAYLELFEYRQPASAAADVSRACQPGIRHLAFLVRDVRQMLDRCVELGGQKINEPVSVKGRATAVYCRDPFGNLIEFIETLGGFPELPVNQ